LWKIINKLRNNFLTKLAFKELFLYKKTQFIAQKLNLYVNTLNFNHLTDTPPSQGLGWYAFMLLERNIMAAIEQLREIKALFIISQKKIMYVAYLNNCYFWQIFYG